MSDASPLIIFVCAYHQEAIAIIKHYKLKKDGKLSQFAYYHNADYALIETGSGKLNAACAVAFIAGKYNINHSAWLNIGIAGHRSLSIGSGVLCHKITDSNTLQNYYPDMSFKASLPTQALVSVDKPELDYALDCLYDMEACGFFHSAARLSTLEHIHSYKVISDNRLEPANNIKPERAHHLIQDCMTDIESLSASLCSAVNRYRKIYKTPTEYRYYTDHLHFTVTQQEQLKILLRRWHAIHQQSLRKSFPVANYRNSKQLLNDVSKHLNKLSEASEEAN